MRQCVFFVPSLPRQELNVVGSKRKEQPYNDARRDYDDEIATVAVAVQRPFRRPHLTVIAYVGGPKKDGRYRPEAPRGLWTVLDPIFEALVQMNAVSGMDSVPLISVGVQPADGEEGIMVLVEELPAPEAAK